MPLPNVDPCDTPNKGCACDTPDEVVDCGQVERRSGDYVSCSIGKRTCSGDNTWGECVGDSVSTMTVPAASQRTLGLGTTSQACIDNPCDPYCQRVVDDSVGLNLDGGPFSTDAGLVLRPSVPLPSGSGCTSLLMTPATQDVTVTATSTPTVKAEYFNQYSKTITQIPSTWAVTGTQTEFNIDYDYGNGAPAVTGMPIDHFSIRWTGSVIPTTTEAYTFYTVTDDGARLWINNTLVIDKWLDQGATEYPSTTINAVAGVPILFRFEYYENTGGASARLRYSSPSISKRAIPASVMGGPDGKRSRLTLTPANPTFSVALQPAGCYSGTLTPAWTLDRFDVATVTAGNVNLISAVPGVLKVTAYAGQFSATGTLNVKVDTTDSYAAPANAVTNFAKTASGTDPMTILYPYAGTVLPLGLIAPTIQWDTGGTVADAVKVSLRYPATGTATFAWNAIIPEPAVPSATIPQAVWKDFENTGKGQDVRIRIQRVLAGTPAVAVSRTLHFSTAPVRGLIYYTQYNRGGSTNMMVTDPSSTTTAKPAFTTVDGCPVCHSVSANGNYLATSDKSWSPTNGGLSKITTGGVATPLTDFVPSPQRDPYKNGGSDWRGFAWAPLTPDGTLALSANNIYGNTKQAVVGINTTAPKTVSVAANLQSGGTGTGLLAQYFPNTTFTAASPLWKRIDPIVSFDFGTGSPGGLVPVDYSVRRSGQIQAYTSEVYTFQIDAVDGVKLTVNGNTLIDKLTTESGAGGAVNTYTGALAMTAGQKVSIVVDQVDTGNESNIKLSWSAPSFPLQIIPQSQLYTNDGVHGMDVAYYSTNNYTGAVTLQRLEPDIYAAWGNGSPAAESALPVDNFSDVWLGRLEAPYTGNVTFCVDADDDVKVTVDTTVVISRPGTTSTNFCGTPMALTQGTLYPLKVEHIEKTGGAALKLRWSYGSPTVLTERIPTANLFAPSAYTPPTQGLTVSYYGDQTFGSTQTANPVIQKAFTRYDANIYDSWGTNRTEYSQLTNSDSFSARWTGLITAPCTGIYEFQTLGNVDDGGRMYIDQQRVANTWATGAFYGVVNLTAGDHSFKFGYYENNNSATVLLQWKVNCQTGAVMTAIPQSAFKPTGDTNASGAVRDGGDNGNGSYYAIWQTPQASTDSPVDVTSAGIGNWGLGSTVMMVPSFAPNGKKLVFVDGDSAVGAGWRKGLSVFDFDQAGKMFTNRRSVVNNWPFGDVVKWPTFESDSRSVIYQATTPTDSCCTNSWTKYGYMGPTNYFEDPGKLFSVDSQATTPTPVALTNLNSGERTIDANKAYQATVSPQAAGGYRWVVFTSTRPYGNTFNLPAVQGDYSNTASYSQELNYGSIQSQLWVSAVDDTTSAATDRSHPAFWIPTQNYSATGANYLNERGFWVLDSCKANGTGSSNTCDVDEDCCGGLNSPKTSVCRLDTPVTDPPTRHCGVAPPVGMCVAQGGVCAASTDCCIGTVCLTGTCSPPPPILILGPASYERTYQATCDSGSKPVWRFFDWKTVTPNSNSKIEFFAQTSATGSDFATLPAYPTNPTMSGVVKVGTASGAPNTSWTGGDVGAKLVAAGYKSQQYLKVTIRMVPNDELTASPTLTNWRQNYSCVPAE